MVTVGNLGSVVERWFWQSDWLIQSCTLWVRLTKLGRIILQYSWILCWSQLTHNHVCSDCPSPVVSPIANHMPWFKRSFPVYPVYNGRGNVHNTWFLRPNQSGDDIWLDHDVTVCGTGWGHWWRDPGGKIRLGLWKRTIDQQQTRMRMMMFIWPLDIPFTPKHFWQETSVLPPNLPRFCDQFLPKSTDSKFNTSRGFENATGTWN